MSDLIEAACELAREPRTYWTDQLDNHDSIAGYHPLGEEIWSQTAGTVDAFVHCVGTAASSRGVATVRTLMCDSGLKYLDTDVYRTV